MNKPNPLPAVLAYIPVIGWLYVFLFQRQNPLAIYHLRQAIGLCLFLIAALVVWAVIAWVLAWISLLTVVGVALFTVVIAAYLYGLVAWLWGMLNAWNHRLVPLPVFGRWASRLPIQ